jgi:hypothetical protein
MSGSHGSEYEDDCLLGCCALMMEAVSTSEMSGNFYQTATFQKTVIFNIYTVYTRSCLGP